MTLDVVALCDGQPEPAMMLAAMQAGGAAAAGGHRRAADRWSSCAADDGRPLVTIEGARLVQVPGEVQRLLGVEPTCRTRSWWVETRAVPTRPGGRRASPAGSPPRWSSRPGECHGRAAERSRASPPATRPPTGSPPRRSSSSSPGRWSALSTWLADAAVVAPSVRPAAAGGHPVRQPDHLPAGAAVRRERRAVGGARRAGGFRDGFLGVPVGWNGARFVPPTRALVRGRAAATPRTGSLEVQVTTLHPAIGRAAAGGQHGGRGPGR